jgi:hypothetical protein
VFDSEDAMAAGLPSVFALDRRRVRDRSVARFGAMRMVDEYVAVYERLVAEGVPRAPVPAGARP